MKYILSIIFTLIIFPVLHAQTIKGTVFDAKTKEPIPGVVVYFDGTSILTTTNNDGRFRLVLERMINADLVFRHLSYEPFIISKPLDDQEKVIYLKEKASTLAEVRVVADRFSREAKMKVFREQFLGASSAGRACVIQNEEDIVINYDNATNCLTAYSIHPIIVDNRYLAYQISFDLRVFNVFYYKENTLNMEKATKIVFKGTSSFTDKNPFNILYAKRREEMYLRSSLCFWKNFTNHTLEQANIKIYNRSRQIEPDRYFQIFNMETQRVVQVLPNTNLNRQHRSVDDISIYGVMGISSDSNRFRSEVVFLTHRFSVDEYGNPDTIDNLLYFGDMGEQRLGDMLPVNFVYTPMEKTKK